MTARELIRETVKETLKAMRQGEPEVPPAATETFDEWIKRVEPEPTEETSGRELGRVEFDWPWDPKASAAGQTEARGVIRQGGSVGPRHEVLHDRLRQTTLHIRIEDGLLKLDYVEDERRYIYMREELGLAMARWIVGDNQETAKVSALTYAASMTGYTPEFIAKVAASDEPKFSESEFVPEPIADCWPSLSIDARLIALALVGHLVDEWNSGVERSERE